MAESHKVAHIFVIGGESLTWETLEPWLKAFPNARFFNEYGPTETVVGCCVYKVNRACQNRRGSVPIGRPIFNTRLFVMKGNKPSLPYQKGELCIASPGVANGYLNREQITAEKFTYLHLQPFAPVRVYRTGDIVSWERSKELMYFGREDAQIKLNGYRIELQEIVHAIQYCTAISDVVVIEKDKTLLAFIQSDGDGGSLSEGSVKADLIKVLPHYMVPHRIIFLASLPITDNGKFDRHKMAGMEPESLRPVRVFPNSMEEICIHKLWLEILSLKGLNGQQLPFESYHTMLDTWLLSIESTHQGGKIILCGHSFGALIAQDLAWLLEQKGYQPLIIMLDACFEDTGGDAEELSGNHLTQLIADIYGVMLPEHSSMAVGFKSVYEQHVKFICDYSPSGQISSPLLYLMAEESPHSGKESVELWLSRWAGRYILSSVRGGHHTMLYRENIATVSSLLEDFIMENLNAPLSMSADAAAAVLTPHEQKRYC
nr:AMP-binding protein [Xenorhabdus kozodoii]